MAKYYFVTTLLPVLKIGSPPEIESRELDLILKMNLTKRDLEKVVALKRLREIENIRAFWSNTPLEAGSTYDEKEIEENLLHFAVYPSYVFEFMEKYEDTQSRLRHFPELLRTFFYQEMKACDNFVHEYFQFEWQWRLIVVVLRAKSLEKDLEKEMQLEDRENPFIQSILEQKDQKAYEPPAAYQQLKTIYEEKKSAPLELQKALSEWRFEKIDHMIESQAFNIDRILGYVVQLELCENWLKLDKKQGLEIVEKVAKGIS